MASRYRSISRPTLNLLKSTITTSTPKSIPSLRYPLSSSSLRRQILQTHFVPISVTESISISERRVFNFRSMPQLGSLQSLLPLHTAVSSARLTSCLGVDSNGSRSLSQGMICSANPGV
ncbi:hypothetical protein Acr_00g0039830 [Actinidia rufa]|uniref:Uncharacterized protein n=1 Tax=Actinidia rufa TaxID=165716 RepID=A0A7J0DJF7_9ERIC|nr:hypothetical protein Acr_00g0039830 [Actinidia rufa]